MEENHQISEFSNNFNNVEDTRPPITPRCEQHMSIQNLSKRQSL